MKRSYIPAVLFLTMALAVPGPAAAQIRCSEPSVERVSYDWALAGALSWVAAIAFPTSGTAELETTANRPGTKVESRLMIRDRDRTGYFLYRTSLEGPRLRTLLSEHGYSWSGRTKIEKAAFDYDRKLLRLSEEDTRDGPSSSVRPIPGGDLRDVLTAIWQLRQQAGTIKGAERVEIFSDGKLYPVHFVAQGAQNLKVGNTMRRVLAFRIVAAPEQQRKWPGGVNVWLTDDEARTPVKIEIKRSLANLRLTMSGAPICGPR